MLHRRRDAGLLRREISILRQLRHPCIVDLRAVLPPPDDPAKFRDLYLVFEYHPLPHLHRDRAHRVHICSRACRRPGLPYAVEGGGVIMLFKGSYGPVEVTAEAVKATEYPEEG